MNTIEYNATDFPPLNEHPIESELEEILQLGRFNRNASRVLPAIKEKSACTTAGRFFVPTCFAASNVLYVERRFSSSSNIDATLPHLPSESRQYEWGEGEGETNR